jgi:uncharacterized protein (TIGR02453 family)
MPGAFFSRELFRFLAELKRHNDRDWFASHRERYERDVRGPMLRFIAQLAGPLGRIDRAVLADPRPQGGSLFRIHRDTRFSKDKSPYKTHVGAFFKHRAARDVHAPGYYLHLEPGRVFGGAGIWHPDPASLRRIRQAIVEEPAAWRRITGARAFRAAGRLHGEVAKRPPRGFDPEHPLIEDLKRKDLTLLSEWTERAALRPDFLQRYLRFCRAAAGFNAFLARALGLS